MCFRWFFHGPISGFRAFIVSVTILGSRIGATAAASVVVHLRRAPQPRDRRRLEPNTDERGVNFAIPRSRGQSPLPLPPWNYKRVTLVLGCEAARQLRRAVTRR